MRNCYIKSIDEVESLMFHMLDEKGRIFYVNDNWLEEMGYEKWEVLGKLFEEFIADSHKETILENIPHLRNYGFLNNIQLKLKRKHGDTIDVILNAANIYNENGKFLNTKCELRDLGYFLNSTKHIIDMLEREKFLKENLYIKSEINHAIVRSTCLEEFLNFIINILIEPIEIAQVYIKDYNDGYMSSNGLKEDLRMSLDYFLKDQEYVIGSSENKVFLFENESRYNILKKVREKFGQDAKIAVLPLNIKKNNINKSMAIALICARKLEPFKNEWINFLEEIIELISLGIVNLGVQDEMEMLLRKLYSISVKDVITGAYNRYKLDVILDEEKQKFIMKGVPFSVIMYDIDGFKNINDEFGHVVGDYILKEVTDVIKSGIRKEDKLFRWGGDEFIIIAPGISGVEVLKLAEKLKNLLYLHEFKVKNLTCSFGITEINLKDSVNSLLKRIDMALYKSKCSGRNCITVL